MLLLPSPPLWLLLLPPLWLLHLLDVYWLSLSRADFGATGCWQDSTGPAGEVVALTVLFPPSVLVYFSFLRGCSGRGPAGEAAALTVLFPPVHVYFSFLRDCSGSRWPPLWLDGRGRRPFVSRVTARLCIDGLVHSPSLTGWYTVCVSSCVCIVRVMYVFFFASLLFNYRPVVAAWGVAAG